MIGGLNDWDGARRDFGAMFIKRFDEALFADLESMAEQREIRAQSEGAASPNAKYHEAETDLF